ncbi:DNA alkylation repair protein, partial [candidate division CSSED10-310 bacterium]
MAEKLKNLFFTFAFIDQLGHAIRQENPAFDAASFEQLVFDESWHDKELKERMRHVSFCLRETLPSDYPMALDILLKVAPSFSSFDAMVFPDYVECFGLDHWDISLAALKIFTQISSSEFAIRAFLIKDPERAMASLLLWADDENHHVRRLTSEGCRPRLPWAVALPFFKEDPGLIFPVLEKLKDDESDYVRKSVANNLNDISKDHPELVLAICERWLGHTKNTDWIVKHACRGMLKKSNEKALQLFG